MKISLVVPAYNEEKYIGECLKAALKARIPEVAEIIVVNNASTDNTSGIASSFPGVKVVLEERKGLVRARARGFKESTGDIVAYVDADTRMPEDWFKTVLREFEKDEKIVALSGSYDYYDLKGLRLFLAHFYWNFVIFPMYFFSRHMLMGANFAARRGALSEIGGFDESIDFYGEDTNLGRRLARIGKMKYKNSFFIWTSGRRLSGEGLVKTGYRYSMNFLWETIFKKPFTTEHKDIR